MLVFFLHLETEKPNQPNFSKNNKTTKFTLGISQPNSKFQILIFHSHWAFLIFPSQIGTNIFDQKQDIATNTKWAFQSDPSFLLH